MIISTGSISLPRLDQDVLGYVAGTIEDSPFNDDALTRDIRTGDVPAEIILKYFKACLIWN
jgi:hypothetical protein